MTSELNKMIKDIEACANKNYKLNMLKCYKQRLIDEIDGKKEVFLRFKIEYEKETDDSIFNAVISVVSLMIATASLMTSLSLNSVQEPDWVKAGLIIALMLYMYLIGYYSIKHIYKKRKYKYIKTILDDMDNNWHEYFKKKS